MSAPAVRACDVAALVATLGESRCWQTAEELSVALFGGVSEAKKRRVRAIASAAGSGIVSYPGSPGYKLWQHCTVDELHACVSAYSSQTDDMRRRRDLYRARLHREHAGQSCNATEALRPTREQLGLFA